MDCAWSVRATEINRNSRDDLMFANDLLRYLLSFLSDRAGIKRVPGTDRSGRVVAEYVNRIKLDSEAIRSKNRLRTSSGSVRNR